MRHRLTFLAAAAASLGLVLTGCSGDAENSAGGGNEDQKPAASKQQGNGQGQQGAGGKGGQVSQEGVRWIDGFCGGLGDFATSFQGVRAANPKDPNAVKQSMSQMLDNLTKGSEKFVAHVDNLGPSPLKGGDKVVSTVKDAYQSMNTTAKQAKSKLDSTPDSNPQATAQAVQAAGKDLSGVMKKMQATGKNMAQSPEVAKASQQAPKCKQIGQMAQQQQQQQQQQAPMPGN